MPPLPEAVNVSVCFSFLGSGPTVKLSAAVTAVVVEVAPPRVEVLEAAGVAAFGWAISAKCDFLLARRIVGAPSVWRLGPRLVVLGFLLFSCCRLASNRVVSDAFLGCSSGPWHRVCRCICRHFFPAFKFGLCIIE